MNRTPRHQRVGTLAVVAMTAFLAHAGSVSADTTKPESNARLELARPQPERVSPTAKTTIQLPDEPAPASEEAETDEFMGGADPDPARFDRDGLEKWWRRYSEQRGKAER